MDRNERGEAFSSLQDSNYSLRSLMSFATRMQKPLPTNHTFNQKGTREKLKARARATIHCQGRQLRCSWQSPPQRAAVDCLDAVGGRVSQAAAEDILGA